MLNNFHPYFRNVSKSPCLDHSLLTGLILKMKSLSNSTNVIIFPSFCWFLPALDTDNAPVKKQVFELLSALCMYSADGYARAIDALGHYKVRTTKRFHLSFHSSAERKTKVKQISWHVYPVVKCGILSLPKWLGIHSFIATYSDQQLKLNYVFKLFTVVWIWVRLEWKTVVKLCFLL